MSFPKLYGINLANGGFIKNFRLEVLNEDPFLTMSGRVWFNDTEKELKYSSDRNNDSVYEKYRIATEENFNEIFYEKTSGTHLTSKGGWRDLTADIEVSTRRKTAPAFIEIPNGIGYYHFSDNSSNKFNNKDQFVYAYFHINHDYRLGSEIFPHVHWMPSSISTGTVLWTFEYTLAKGHNQSEILNNDLQCIELLQAGKGLEYEHMVVECQPGEGFCVEEEDTYIVCKLTRKCSDDRDTFDGSAIGITLDLHYYADHISTPGKEPDFQEEYISSQLN